MVYESSIIIYGAWETEWMNGVGCTGRPIEGAAVATAEAKRCGT